LVGEVVGIPVGHRYSPWGVVAHATIARNSGSCRRASDAKLDRGQRNLRERAITLQGHVDRAPDELADERPLEIADARDRAAVDRDDDVAGAHAGRRSRAAVQELDDLEPGRAAEALREGGGQATGAAHDAQVRA